MIAQYVLTVPISTFFILNSNTIHPAYRMNLCRRLWLGFRMFWNTVWIPTGTTYKTHLAMALKVLETPPEVKGDIIECGTWKGGCATNLSLVCKITGRKLRIYDSFEALPDGEPNDRYAKGYKKGDFTGTLEEVKENIRKHGAIEGCEFVKGWFKDTLPQIEGSILLAFLDVDLEASLHTCVRWIWPHLVEKGFIFIDEAVAVDYCALFFSETWWQRYMNRKPPDLIGTGMGLAMVNITLDPRRNEQIIHCNTTTPAHTLDTKTWFQIGPIIPRSLKPAKMPNNANQMSRLMLGGTKQHADSVYDPA